MNWNCSKEFYFTQEAPRETNFPRENRPSLNLHPDTTTSWTLQVEPRAICEALLSTHTPRPSSYCNVNLKSQGKIINYFKEFKMRLNTISFWMIMWKIVRKLSLSFLDRRRRVCLLDLAFLYSSTVILRFGGSRKIRLF